MSWKKV